MLKFIFSKKQNLGLKNYKNFCTNIKQGIFSIDYFKDAKTIADSTKNILEKYKSIVNVYPKMKTNTKLIEVIDNISNDCCTLIDGATALYHLHPNQDIKNESFKTIIEINNFFEELNTNKKFYHKSLDLYFSELMTSWDFMNMEQPKILDKNIEELSFFNKDKQDSTGEKLSEEIENLLNDYKNPTEIKYDFEISESEINNLSSQILKTILQVFIKNSSEKESQEEVQIEENKVRTIKADYELLTTILKKSDNKDISDRAYRSISAEFGKENINLMVDILKLRLKYANRLGYKTYAEYQLQMQTLKIKPEKLTDILKEMWIDLRPNLIDDLRNLFSNEKGDLNLDKVDSYLTYYEVDSVRSSFIDKYLKTLDEKTFTRRFITVGNLFNGLSLLTKNLFNKDLVAEMDEDLIKEETIHESILLSYLKSGDQTIAKIYFDMFTREGKFKDVFSQFTIQGSKTLNLHNHKLKQIPKVILATNFEVTDLDLLNMQVSFTDAKSILHEYGHVLHSVLSKTDFQSLSGNRIPLDFAEIPSHLMEYFIYDYTFCKNWMVDKKSGQVIDKKLHNLFCLQSGMFANLDLQETLHHSIFDLEIHSFENESDINVENILKIHQNLITNFYISSIFSLTQENFEAYQNIVQKYSGKINFKFAVDKFYENIVDDKMTGKINHNLEFNKEVESLIEKSKNNNEFLELKQNKEKIFKQDYIFTTIPHFKSYPSNYYTYIIGKIFANLIWTDLITKGDLNKVGSILEKEYLSKGYTESPIDLIKNLFMKH